MNQRRLPPLNAIRAFDAVARQGNMSKASLELGVSPPTVTHHLQTLEEFLGIKLVIRTSNSMSLTKKGKAYSEAIRHGFDILANATDALVQDEINDPLRISCVPTLSNTWFANRLTELEKQYPGLDIQCDFSPTPVSFDQDRCDLAIRYGEGHYPDADSQLLFVDKVAPVCAPELAQRIRESNDLLEVPRLRSPEMTPDQRSLWYHWGLLTFGKEFADKIDVTGGTILQSARFIVEALKVNECVALLDYASVSAELRSGHLASPLGLWVDAPFGYHLLTPKRRTPRAPVRVLKVLLKRNIHEMQYKEKD